MGHQIGGQESTYKSSTHPVHDSIGQISSTLVSVPVDIEPMNFRQVFKKKQQLMSVRPISSTFQKMGGLRNVANFTEQCRRWLKEGYEAIVHVRMSTGIWVTGNVFNGFLTLVDDQRGRIEVSGASRIKEEVTHPRWDVVLQEMFVFGLSMDTNQI